ncbi:MAG: hypothetical protein Q7J35_08465 [Candidatus Methanoperedens sp.]|nr:hypothetical protein [Candidatus Methanoperedens sp.]
MKKTIIVAFMASICYFIIYILITYTLKNAAFDWQSALKGAVVFWIFIYLVHFFMNRAERSY